MKIMLDCSPDKIAEYRERYGDLICQLRTPLTRYRRAAGVLYGVDNGCFGDFDEAAWLRLVAEALAGDDLPIFITLPDIVGDAPRTVELFHQFKAKVPRRRALVLQDGLEHVTIPWGEIDAVFIGGSDQFKSSPAAFRAAKAAKMLGCWVHIGRVNTAARARNWLLATHNGKPLADSCDGSGMSMYDHMLLDVLATVAGKHPQQAMTV